MIDLTSPTSPATVADALLMWREAQRLIAGLPPEQLAQLDEILCGLPQEARAELAYADRVAQHCGEASIPQLGEALDAESAQRQDG